MPSHAEDIRCIPIIQQNIAQQTTTHPNHIHILCGYFNKDIALIGRQNKYNTTPPQTKHIEWCKFTDNLQFTYIPTNIPYSRQGGQNYNQTSLINGYYIKIPNNALYTSIIHPPNALLAHHPPPTTNKQKKILNPIPQENIKKFKTKFFEENALQINELTNILTKEQLTSNQWRTLCTKIEQLLKKILELNSRNL